MPVPDETTPVATNLAAGGATVRAAAKHGLGQDVLMSDERFARDRSAAPGASGEDIPAVERETDTEDRARVTRPFDALIVDYGGVLTTPMQDAMQRFATETGIELQDLVRAALGAYSGANDALVTDFEVGAISEEEFSVAFAERLTRLTGKPIEAAGLVGRIFRLQLEEAMLEAVSRARRHGLKTALLSNSWGLGIYPRARLSELFDVVVISGEVGLRKPDPAIFVLTADRLGAPANRCLFVDDVSGHLGAAAAEGMTTVLHVAPDQTIARLEELLGLSLSGSS